MKEHWEYYLKTVIQIHMYLELHANKLKTEQYLSSLK